MPTVAMQKGNPNGEILVNATHGNEDAERATLPFVVGNVSATADQET